MEENDRWSVRVSLWAAVLALVIIVAVLAYIFTSGEFHHLAVEGSERIPLTSLVPVESLSEVWFSPSGRLFATFQRGTILFLTSWDPARNWKAPPMSVFDFSALSGTPDKPVSIVSSFHGGTSAAGTVPPDRVLAYSVSDDGSSIAWAWRSQLFWGPTEKPAKVLPKVKGIKIPAAPVTAVSIIGIGFVATVHADGNARLWDVINRKMVIQYPQKPGLRLAWCRGARRIFSPEIDASPVELRFIKGKPHFEKLPGIPRDSCFACSSSGVSLAGTGEGMIITLKSKGPNPIAVVKNARKVLALAAYDKKWVIAGGEGSGLALVKNGVQVADLLSTPEQVRLLAVNSNHLAYATSHSLVGAAFGWKIELSEKAKWLLAVMFSLIGFISFLRVVIIDILKLRRRNLGQASEAATSANEVV